MLVVSNAALAARQAAAAHRQRVADAKCGRSIGIEDVQNWCIWPLAHN